MENLKVIKDRIRTVNSIVKATSAMKMVSTVKLAKMNNLNKFSKECSDILLDMFSRAVGEIKFNQEFENEGWIYRNNGDTLIIVLSMNQGFCGSFSQSIIDKAKELINNNRGAYVETFGKKSSVFEKKTLDIELGCEIPSIHDIDDFSSVLAQLVSRYIREHNVYRVYVVSGEFKNVLVQRARTLELFPVASKENFVNEPCITIEGSRLDFVNNLFQMYLSKRLKGIVTEHVISELSARVMAMDNSVRNANDMFEKLNVLYNRVRQARITQELTEIVSSIECVQ